MWQFQNLGIREALVEANRVEQEILDAVVAKLCGDGIIRQGEEIARLVTATGFACYTMPNYHSPENNCVYGKNALDSNAE